MYCCGERNENNLKLDIKEEAFMDGSLQDWSISIANAMQILQYFT